MRAAVCKVCGEQPCFTHCVYCGVDCDLPEPVHDPACPSVTGLFPVRPEDLGAECVHCGKRTPGFVCSGCEVPFEVGDFYCQVKIEDGPIPVYELVCIGCKVSQNRDSAT